MVSLRAKLSAATRRANENQEFYAKKEREHYDLVMSRNGLAWLVLNCIEVLEGYDGAVLKLARVGIQAELDGLMPDFRQEIRRKALALRKSHLEFDLKKENPV